MKKKRGPFPVLSSFHSFRWVGRGHESGPAPGSCGALESCAVLESCGAPGYGVVPGYGAVQGCEPDHVNESVPGACVAPGYGVVRVCEPALDDGLARMSLSALVREPDHANESVLVFGSVQRAFGSGQRSELGLVYGSGQRYESGPAASGLREP